jgi:hypothetical protein
MRELARFVNNYEEVPLRIVNPESMKDRGQTGFSWPPQTACTTDFPRW